MNNREGTQRTQRGKTVTKGIARMSAVFSLSSLRGRRGLGRGVPFASASRLRANTSTPSSPLRAGGEGVRRLCCEKTIFALQSVRILARREDFPEAGERDRSSGRSACDHAPRRFSRKPLELRPCCGRRTARAPFWLRLRRAVFSRGKKLTPDASARHRDFLR